MAEREKTKEPLRKKEEKKAGVNKCDRNRNVAKKTMEGQPRKGGRIHAKTLKVLRDQPGHGIWSIKKIGEMLYRQKINVVDETPLRREVGAFSRVLRNEASNSQEQRRWRRPNER